MRAEKRKSWLFWLWPVALLLALLFVRSFFRGNTYAAGERLYHQYCANCHGPEGKGFANLYPPLAASDYLAPNRHTLALLIRNGAQDSMLVNGIWYQQYMPPAKELAERELSVSEIQSLLNYIGRAWGEQLQPFDYKEVKAQLEGVSR